MAKINPISKVAKWLNKHINIPIIPEWMEYILLVKLIKWGIKKAKKIFKKKKEKEKKKKDDKFNLIAIIVIIIVFVVVGITSNAKENQSIHTEFQKHLNSQEIDKVKSEALDKLLILLSDKFYNEKDRVSITLKLEEWIEIMAFLNVYGTVISEGCSRKIRNRIRIYYHNKYLKEIE